MEPIRILIADDHAILRSGLRLLLGAQPDLEVIGEAADAAATLQAARAAKPDIVLLDFSMPGGRAADTIAQLCALDPNLRVVVLTMHDDSAYAEAAMAAGAAGYVVKRAADVELITAIRAVHHGRTFVDLTRPDRTRTSITAAGMRRGAPGPAHQLSTREMQVVRLLATGNTNAAVAEQLDISIKTVETYRARLTAKLGLKGRAQLFRYAEETGLLGGTARARA